MGIGHDVGDRYPLLVLSSAACQLKKTVKQKCRAAWMINGIQNPIDYYGSTDKETYKFCNNLLIDAKRESTPGYFNKYEDPNKHIHNMGVIEVDFDEDMYNRKIKNKPNEPIVLIKSEELINNEYY